MAANDKSERRTRIKKGIRKKISGTSERPRLSVFRSNKEIYVQVINDLDQKTLVGTSSRPAPKQRLAVSEVWKLLGLQRKRALRPWFLTVMVLIIMVA